MIFRREIKTVPTRLKIKRDEKGQIMTLDIIKC